MDRTKFCTGGPYIEPVNNVNPANPAVQLIKNGTIIGIRIGNEAMNAMVDKVPITPTALSDAARALRKALDARGFTTRCRS